MANFDYRKFLKENKSTFFSSLTEGQFSWMTHDTEKQIGSEPQNTITVYMHDNEGNTWKEDNYEGYGEFGGMDYYELLDKMNGGEGDRSEGIRLAFDDAAIAAGKVLFPALTEDPTYPKGHDFTQEAKNDPNQSWYAPEEDEDDDDDYSWGDQYGDDEEELDEASMPTFDVATTEKIAQKIADVFTAEDDLDLKYVVTPGASENSFDLDVERGPNTPDKDFRGQDIENYLGDTAGGSFYIKNGVVYNAAMRNAPVAKVSPKGEVEMISAEESRAAIGMEENKEETKSNKMKKSELKEMIKSAFLNEKETFDQAFDRIDKEKELYPGSDKDDVKEAEEEVSDEVEVDVEEPTDEVPADDAGDMEVTADAEAGLTGEKKDVQDNLEAALEAAKALGDQKLVDQIGNSITFFTRQHVVGTGETMEEVEDSMKVNEVEFPMWTKIKTRK